MDALNPMMFMHNAWWQENQVVVTFESRSPIVSFLDGEIVSNKAAIIESLKIDELNGFLKQNGFSIQSITVQDTLRPLTATQEQPPNLVGKYLFRTVTPDQQVRTSVICFFHFDDLNSAVSMPSGMDMHSGTSMDSGMDMGPGVNMSTDSKQNAKDDDEKGEAEDNDADDTQQGPPPPQKPKGAVPRIVDTINANLQLLQNAPYHIPITAACPAWYSAGNPTLPTGCPAIPPIPIPEGLSCSTSPGLWPISFPTLSSEMQELSGDGTTVFILDTLPRLGDLARAAEATEEHNLLMLDVVNNATLNYKRLPDSLDVPGPNQPSTGRDIEGRLIGFRIPDHGLFVAGLVRDIAPGARVECVRVLNDMCVGDMATVTKALEDIANRMSEINPDTKAQGDLYQKPVVINLSLIISPSDSDVTAQQVASDLDLIRKDMLEPMSSLIQLGAVFVTSAGNEADLRSGAAIMNPTGVRPKALYPAAFAYDSAMASKLASHSIEILPVGAVDSNGKTTSYSCYPGNKGIATYGGEVPKAAATPGPDGLTQAIDIDAVIGLYSALWYPALSYTDPHPRYPTPNAHGWAYWVGTSFAAPIISGLAARVMEAKLRGQIPQTASVSHTILNNVAKADTIWTRVTPDVSSDGNILGKMIMAVQQCPGGTTGSQGQTQTKKKEDEDEGSVHIKISYERE